MTFYVIIRGYAGVGKSTVAKRLAQAFRGHYISIDKVLSDNGLDKIEGECISEENFRKANEILLPEAISHLGAGEPVVIDGNFYHRSQLEHLTMNIPYKPYIFTLKANIEDCIRRDNEREEKDRIGEDAIRAVCSLVERFDAGKVIDTTGKTANDIVEEILLNL
jgi:predicted kinase